MAYFTWKDFQIFYTQKGNGQPLIILPGNTATSAAHAAEIEYFSQSYIVFAIDFLGTGKSDRLEIWPADWYEQAAEQVNELIKSVTGPAILMGTSGGAVVALLAAIQSQGQIKAVIADSCPMTFTKELVQNEIVSERSLHLPEQVQFWEYCNGSDWEKVVNADTEMLIKFVDKKEDPYKGQLNQIQCPVLLSGCAGDSSVPNIAQQYSAAAEDIPKCKIVIKEGGEHPFMWSLADDFKKTAEDFLRSLVEL